MKANLLLENLTPILPLLGRMASSHSQIPALTSILIEVKEGQVSFSATDLEFGISFTSQGKTDGEGGLLVPNRQFVELMGSLGRGKTLLTQEKDQLIIETGGGVYRFQTLPKDEFPKLYEEKGEEVGEFTPQEFADTFERLTFAASQDESRPHLTGVYIVAKEDGIDYVATDGFRLSLKRSKNKNSPERLKEGLILPQRLLQELAVLKSTENIKLFVYDKGNQAVLETGGAVIVGRLIEGKYPDYERVIPGTLGTGIKLDREEFGKALKTVSVFARENANVISFHLSNGIITLSVASSSIGAADVKLEGVQSGEDCDISFNVRFVQDFLKVASGKYVTMKVNSPQEPAVFTADDDPDFTHVIMPVRVQE